MKDVKIIIFDADGTIFDSMPFTAKIFADVLEKYGIRRKNCEDYIYATAGTPAEKVFGGILKKYNKPTKGIKKIISQFFDLLEKDSPALFNDAVTTLKKLKKYRKIISTNLRQDILNTRIKSNNLGIYLDKYLGTNGFKSKEEHFKEIKRIYGMSDKEFTENAILVGDGKRDMEFARKYKIIGVGKLGSTDAKTLKEAGATYIINSLSEIFKLLENGKKITKRYR